jgi:hypothetical protein
VVLACNPSYLGGGGWRCVVWGHTGQRVSKTQSQLISHVSPQLYTAVTLALWCIGKDCGPGFLPWAKTEPMWKISKKQRLEIWLKCKCMHSKLEVLSSNPSSSSPAPKMGKCWNKFGNAFIREDYLTEYWK